MRHKALLLAVLLGCADPVYAQTQVRPLPNSVDILILPATGSADSVAPIATRNTPIAAGQNCNLTSVSAPLVNPTTAEFDDPFTRGRVCRVPLPALLPGIGYRGVAVFIATTCQDPVGTSYPNCQSVRSIAAMPPFNVVPVVPVPPSAPTNLRFVMSSGVGPSPSGTLIPPATSLVDATGHSWALGPLVACPGPSTHCFQIVRDDLAIGAVGYKLKIINGQIHILGWEDIWYLLSGSTLPVTATAEGTTEPQ